MSEILKVTCSWVIVCCSMNHVTPGLTFSPLQERRAEQEVVESQQAQDQAVAGLSEREKRALAAERRMAQQLPSASTVQR